MAKLVTKFKYLKPNARQSVGGYARYIATREGVEKIDESYRYETATKRQDELIQKILRDFPDSREMLEYEDYQKSKTIGNASEFITRALEDNAHEVMASTTYADYIATRPRAERFGSHGLFTDEGEPVKLGNVSEELNSYEGNVWTVIISLRREDAERLGYNTGERWRDMLRTQTQALAENFKIPMENLKWYAAFHNESHHPHVHLMVYADGDVKPYLSKQGVSKLRSEFAKDIFAQDLLCIYEKQTEHRDELRGESRQLVQEIVAKINAGEYQNPKVEELLLELSERLSKTKGKKQYGYLKPELKALVNRIVSELASDERLNTLYELWYEQKEATIKTYTEELPERIPLVDNPEFKSIKNVVIAEAMNIEKAGEDLEDQPETSMYTHQDHETEQESWWTTAYKKARVYLYGAKGLPPDFEKAHRLMLKEANLGNGYAMHDIGKMYLLGFGCEKDEEKAQEWFEQTYCAFLDAEKQAEKKGYLQYRIGKLFSLGYGVEQDYSKAAKWYEKGVSEENPFAAYALGSLYHRGQGVPQDDGKAYPLFVMAATDREKPNAYAAYELGKMCKEGIGTQIDEIASEEWYRKAYEGFCRIERTMADDKLYYRLGRMNLKGLGTEVNLEKAKEYFEQAVLLENVDAMYSLGKLYWNKEFAEHDREKALHYISLAAEHGNEYAARFLSAIRTNQSWSAMAGSIRLFHHLSQMLQDRWKNERSGKTGITDRKLKRKIDEKKEAHGLRHSE